MNELVERGAIRLFWRAEHLDPSEEGDVPDGEAFGDSFPAGLSERKRQFWRYLMIEGIRAMREPTEAMLRAPERPYLDDDTRELFDKNTALTWEAMIDAALADE